MNSGSPFVLELKDQIKGEVLIDKASLGLYSTDSSAYQIFPEVVVLPKDEQDVITALKLAKEYKVSVLSRGGGTSLAGQTVGQSMVLDFSKYMNEIIEINPEEKWARVQPGLVRDILNVALAPHGLHYAPDPATSSRATVGGMIANNSAGTKSVLYGKTIDHLISIKVALDDGTILHMEDCDPSSWNEKASLNSREGNIYIQVARIVKDHEQEIIDAFPKVMRRVQGYNLDEFAGKTDWNLAKLICGSEGTLATILEATIQLTPLPKTKMLCAMHFGNLADAIKAVNPILDYSPSAVEILDHTVLEFSRKNLTTARHTHFIEGNPEAILVVEFYGDNQKEVTDRVQSCIEKVKSLSLGYSYPVYLDGEDFEDVWMVRKKGLGLMLGMKGKRKPLAFIEDSAIPVDVLPDYIEEVSKVCSDLGVNAALYAHASVGVIHVRPILDLRNAKDIEKFKIISEKTFDLVKKYKGSWSGEHGDGLVRSYKLKEYFGDTVYGLLQEVKSLFDPDNRMNPGKIVNAQPIDENLRYGAAYSDMDMDTVYHFREDTSFSNAVHMCTGVGECRKLRLGTMCPSFRATRDEEHSTRGRANLLRLAMSGQLSEDDITDSRVIEALDLCLSCKACKSECPSNVDMAKLKSEVWQKKYDRKGIPLRDRFVRDSSKMASIFSGVLAPMINGIQQTTAFRLVLEKTIGIEKKRILPGYEKTSFATWFKKSYIPNGAQKEVALFADTYLNHHETSVGRSALSVLDKLGYKVHLAEVGCCQRPKISHGFLKSAKSNGTNTANALDHYLSQGIPVVACEPSCASALNDDLPDLVDDTDLADRLKSGVMMIDQFIASEIRAGRIDLSSFRGIRQKIVIHGHCHQKALYGTDDMKFVMSQVDGVSVNEIPSGCCGMAGSFGYEKEHYELSEQIGKEVLLPSIAKLKEEDILVASGFSCRHQIDHFSEKKAVHWVEALDQLMNKEYEV